MSTKRKRGKISDLICKSKEQKRKFCQSLLRCKPYKQCTEQQAHHWSLCLCCGQYFMAWRSTFEWQQVWTCSRFFHTHLLSKEATLPSAAAEPKLRRRRLCCSFSCESQMANQANYCCFCHEHLSWSPMNGTGSQSVVAFKTHKRALVSGAAWQRSAAIASDSPQCKWATKMVEKMMVCLFVAGVVSLGSRVS